MTRQQALGYRSPPTNTGMHYRPRTEAFERLQLDGGWLTVALLAMQCDQTEATVDRTLRRQVAAGWLTSRVVQLGNGDARHGGKANGRQRRVEYRALGDPDHWREL